MIPTRTLAAWTLCLGCLLAGAGLASAQQAEPLPANPLAPPASWWQGTFADKELTISLREAEGRVAGELTIGGQTYQVQGRTDEEGQLLCAFSREGAPSWGLLMSAEDGGRTLVVQSGGATRRLDKQADAPAALPEVRAGQRWVYDMTASGMAMRQIYEVVAVDGKTVKCRLHMLMKMPGQTEFTAQGEPTPYDYQVPEGALEEQPESPDVVTRREKVTVAGREWDCLVTETQGTTVWVPLRDGRVTFPPYLKLTSLHTEAELSAILEPKK